MSVDATSSSSVAPSYAPPVGDDPPKADAKKPEEKKQLSQSAAADTKAPATTTKDVTVFVARVKRDGGGQDVAKAVGAGVVGVGCGTMTKLTIDQLGGALGPVGKGLVSIGSAVAGSVVGVACAPAGSRAGAAVYDAVTGGPNTITIEKQTVKVEVPAPKSEATKPDATKADAKTKSSEAPKDAKPTASAPSTSSSSKPAPAPNASTLPYTPAPSGSAWTDPNASYLRPGASK